MSTGSNGNSAFGSAGREIPGGASSGQGAGAGLRGRLRSRWVVLAVLVGVALLVLNVASAQQGSVRVEAYGFELSCDATAFEGSTLACTLSNTGDEAADWPTVGIVHLSSDADRALVVGAPIDVQFGTLAGSPDTEQDVSWIGDELVGFSRFDWDGQAAAGGDAGDSRTVNITVIDDTAWEPAESFYVSLAPSGSRGAGLLYDNRARVTVSASDTKSGDATLSSLEISAGGIGDSGSLSVPLARRDLSVPYATTTLTLTPTAVQSPSGIAVAVTSSSHSGSFSAQDGEETELIPLAAGATTITVTVTAENGVDTQAYELVVTRASLASGASVAVTSGAFTLTCPGTVTEGTTLECTLENTSEQPAAWPVVGFVHSSLDAQRALIAEDALIPATSSRYGRDIELADPQSPAVENYDYGYGELFSGGSRSVYAIYGFEKFDWTGTAAAGASRTVSVSVLADELNEHAETFHAALAPSGYTGLSDLVDNMAPIVVSDSFVVELEPLSGGAAVSWTGPATLGGTAVSSYDLRHVRSDAADKADGNWQTLTSIWATGGGEHSYRLTGLTLGVSYDVQLRAVAGSTTGPWTVTHTVTPATANASPEFPSTETGNRVVAENSAVGTAVGAAVAATDPDGDQLTYSLQQNDRIIFSIDTATGQLLIAEPPDFETASSHTVTVSVSDGKDPDGEADTAVDATKTVTITITDGNEPPVISGPEAVEIVENATDPLGTYTAVDEESDSLSLLLGGADAAVFGITSGGELSFVSAPDYEAPADTDRDNVYEIQVQVSDGVNAAGEPDAAVDTSLDVSVTVTDQPAHPSLEVAGAFSVFYPENSRSPVAPYSVMDEDLDGEVWSLGGEDAAVFEISRSGVLSFVAAPDHENPADSDRDNVYEIQVQVSDGVDASGEPDATVDASVDVSVTVTDTHERPVLPAVGNVTFLEHSTGLVADFTAVVAESGSLSWYVAGADGSSFEISSTGELRFVSAPDFEAPADSDRDNVYEVEVAVEDGTNEAGEVDRSTDASVAFTVTVVGENEPPVVTGTKAVEVAENSTAAVGAYTAVDPESDSLVWSLGGADAARFQISAAGVLSFVAAPDYEDPADSDRDNVYEVQVQAGDGKDAAGETDPSVDAFVDVSVGVTDVNEAPAISGAEAVEVAENTTEVVGAYTAVDPESDSLVWSLGGADAARFQISAAGVLSFVAAPDYEDPADADGDNAYEVQVQAGDGKDATGRTDPSVDAFVGVSVGVTDVNEAPAISGAEAVEVAENTTEVVGVYTAVDPESDSLVWSLGGADAARFEVSAAGVLGFVAAPDYEDPADSDRDNVYEVQVRVSDGKDATGRSDPSVDAFVGVSVGVTDVNEAPMWSDSELARLKERLAEEGFGRGAVRDVRVWSEFAGVVVVRWREAWPVPAGHVVQWAPASEGLDSAAANSVNVDMDYGDVDRESAFEDPVLWVRREFSARLEGLDPEALYLVRVRAEYGDDGDGGMLSGPWSVPLLARADGRDRPGTMFTAKLVWGEAGAEGGRFVGVSGPLRNWPSSIGSIETRYWDDDARFGSQSVVLAQMQGAISSGPAAGLTDPVILRLVEPAHLESGFVLEVDGVSLFSAAAVDPHGQLVDPHGQPTTAKARYWMWDAPCVDWQIGEHAEVRLVLFDVGAQPHTDTSLASLCD